MRTEEEVIAREPFKYVSLFSGMGGFEQALNKLGGECVMASEIDKFANQSYEVLYGHKTVGDVTKVEATDVPDHDLLVGGFPCQAFSVAGNRNGFNDTRGTLFFEIARIAKEKQPKALLLENVKGLVGHDGGKTLDIIIETLHDIGYTVDFEVLNSKYFGVPQHRERIFIVAVRDDLVKFSPWVIGKRADVVAKGKRRIEKLNVSTFNFDFPAQDTCTVKLRDILETNVDEKFYMGKERTEKLIKSLEEKHKEDVIILDASQEKREGKPRIYTDYSPTLQARDFKEPRMVGHIDLKGHDAIKRVYSPEGVAPTLTTMGGGHREPKIAEHQQYTDYRIRKLTPRECFRLQNFPDSAYDKLVEAGLSNSQLYKQAGNAVTVSVVKALGERLLPYLTKGDETK